MIKFSVVIALAPDRDAPVKGSLKKVNYPKNKFEIIIEVGKNPSDNRNRGVKKAKGEIIVFIDDDALVGKNIFKNAEIFFEEHPEIAIMGGPQLTPNNDKLFARSSGYVMASYFGTYTMSNRYKEGKLNLDADEFSLTSANCFVRKNVFKKIDGFNPKLFPGEDPEFFARAKRNGFKIAYAPNIIVYHRRRPTIIGLFKQFYKYGKVRMKKERINRTRLNPVFIIPTLCILYVALTPLFLFYSLWFLLPYIVYVILVIISSLVNAMKYEVRAFLLMLFIYPLLHVSYGVGMLRGLFNG